MPAGTAPFEFPPQPYSHPMGSRWHSLTPERDLVVAQGAGLHWEPPSWQAAEPTRLMRGHSPGLDSWPLLSHWPSVLGPLLEPEGKRTFSAGMSGWKNLSHLSLPGATVKRESAWDTSPPRKAGPRNEKKRQFLDSAVPEVSATFACTGHHVLFSLSRPVRKQCPITCHQKRPK